MATSSRRPPPKVAMPAASTPSIAGRPVLIGQPRIGWRPAIAVFEPETRDGQTAVPVLPEPEFWRAEFSPHLNIATHLEPIDNVWIDHFPAAHATSSRNGSAHPDLDDLASTLAAEFDVLSADPTRPPPRHPIPAARAGRLIGRTLIHLATGTGRWTTDIATTDPQLRDGQPQVLVTDVVNWWRWIYTAAPPPVCAVALDSLWAY